MSHALNLSYRFNAAKTHDPKGLLPIKGAGTLRRAVPFAVELLRGFWVDGTWNVPTTLRFWVDGTWNVPNTLSIVGYVQTVTTVERRGYNG